MTTIYACPEWRFSRFGPWRIRYPPMRPALFPDELYFSIVVGPHKARHPLTALFIEHPYRVVGRRWTRHIVFHRSLHARVLRKNGAARRPADKNRAFF